MVLIGLTGGIASGKSTVARLLKGKGAEIIDADLIAREVVAEGTPGLQQIATQFGREVLQEDGSLDREKMGEIVFVDQEARLKLEAITHPAILSEIANRIEKNRGTNNLVVIDAALLTEILGDRGRSLGVQALVVVVADPSDQVARLWETRSMAEEDAQARISSQASMPERMAIADYILDNRGTPADLENSVDQLWERLNARFKN